MIEQLGEVLCPHCRKQGALEHHAVDVGLQKQYWQVRHRRAVGLSIVESVCWFDAWPPEPGKQEKKAK